MAVTLKDVAKRCRVSANTVSVILNRGSDAYKADTCRRVRQAARDMGYQPNPFARGLRTQRSGLVGVLARDLSYESPVKKLTAIQGRASGLDLRTLICLTRGDADRALQATREFTQICDGVLLMCSGGGPQAVLGTEALEALDASGVPYVAVDSSTDVCPAISVDRGAGTAEAVRELVTEYDSYVHLLTEDFPDAPRVRAYRDTLAATGRADRLKTVRGPERWPAHGAESGYAAGTEVAASAPDRTLVLCRDDRVALGLLRRVAELGIAVPDRMGVVGFDDDSFARFTVPPLSSIAQPTDELATEAMGLICDLIEETDADRGPARTGLRTRFVRRASA